MRLSKDEQRSMELLVKNRLSMRAYLKQNAPEGLPDCESYIRGMEAVAGLLNIAWFDFGHGLTLVYEKDFQ